MKHPLLLLPLLLPAAAALGAPDDESFSPELSPAAPIAISTAAAYAKDDSKPDAKPEEPAPKWCQPGGWWLTLGAGVANNFSKDTDYNLHAGFSTFVAKDLEFSVELAGWYFAQVGPDTGGVNPNMVFRWHFWHDEAYTWTVYGDVGIGLLFAFDDVPDGGTSFDFTPRAGGGITYRIDDNARLQVGVRYHHISNGRIEGDAQNPSRDSLMFYMGIIFPL